MKVLELGCGNSQLCDNLYKDGVTDITCIDLSAVAVERMQKRVQSKGYKGMHAFHLCRYNYTPHLPLGYSY